MSPHYHQQEQNSNCLCRQLQPVAVAGGNEGQLVVVGEEEVHSTLDFCDCGQWGG